MSKKFVTRYKKQDKSFEEKELDKLLESYYNLGALKAVHAIYQDEQFWNEPLECVEKHFENLKKINQIKEESEE